ncbi:Stage II sporulation protein E [Caloramator mitchellensis]|uniref:Stage II sporulation protein E n=1 Tax=Caloramator mitchellensis TaxID=908809 RepID=A0A0R3JT28_CALMK|nr:stage II sporulation protein E [Caloramator mitchellensis]KRQ86673.1 Stage II sporulation protein E [Caloramator mitchellensis]
MLERGIDVKVSRKEKFTLRHLALFAALFLVSRVVLLNEIMPFGISLLIAAALLLEREYTLLAGIFVILGYLTQVDLLIAREHILLSAIVILYSLIKRGKSKFINLAVIASILNIALSVYTHKFILKNLALYDFVIVLFETFILVSSAYIFNHGISAFLSNKKIDLIREEIVSIILIFAISFAGIWDIGYKYFSLKSSLAFLIVIAIAYLRGSQSAAAAGILFGFVSNFTDNFTPYILGIYGFSGLIAGAFRDMGRILTASSMFISAGILILYSNKLDVLSSMMINMFIPSLVFVVIPSSIYEKINLYFDVDKKKDAQQNLYMERIKDYINIKLDAISKSLNSLSGMLNEKYEHGLSKNNEIKGVIEKVANRVCANCGSRAFCWSRETYITYETFFDLLRTSEKNGRLEFKNVPDNFKLKCSKLHELIKQINFEMEIMRINSRWSKKLVNSKKILAEQIRGISVVVSDLIKDVTKSVEFKSEIEAEIAVELESRGIKFNDVLVTKNSANKYEVTIYGTPCTGRVSCNSEVSRIVSDVLNRRMIRENSMCRIDEGNKICQYKLIEAENYGVAAAVARASKEDLSGDSYYFGNVAPGRYILSISDGMGSGFEAAMESNTTITLLEKFMEAGFDRNTTMKAINSILLLKNDSESFATVDLGIIDLYEGVGEFIKIGAASTFIKSGRDVSIINNKSLPIGVMDEIEVESEIVEFKNGDIIVMVSDGVTDADSELKDKWVSKLLREYSSGNPKDIADYILEKTKEKYGDELKDDITVIAAKIWMVTFT